ncbi:MAG TPA: type II/IV secretion system ATPase subunit [archaeon]|nr:type II/IV secretion system ATPase subunit [archaeon]
MIQEVLEEYRVTADNVVAKVEIKYSPAEFVSTYNIALPEIEKGTAALLDKVRENLTTQIPIKSAEILDLTLLENLKEKLYKAGFDMIKKELPNMKDDIIKYLTSSILHDMLGLGKFELLLADGNLEEVSINNSSDPAWVYHKKFGWLKTNMKVEKESDILNMAASIGRRVGRQISVLTPLLDAHLPTGDRVNATLFPISTKGNTLSIRKFRRQPMTITDLIEYKTMGTDVAAFLWFAVQYEMNTIIAGGTASGKTSILNVLTSFMQPNHRVVSIEDTRELLLPGFLHWVPLNTREPNPEGKGEISMLDLLINSLRMRPDRIIVGEIRRAREAEVLFEAMHTGHSVYATFHSDSALEAYRRFTNPPIDVPEVMMESLHLFLVAFRDRRSGIRRVFEIAEILPSFDKQRINTIYKWQPGVDKIARQNRSQRVMEELKMFTGMSDNEIDQDIRDKETILKWIVGNKVNNLNNVGSIIANYYLNSDKVVKAAKSNASISSILSL